STSVLALTGSVLMAPTMAGDAGFETSTNCRPADPMATTAILPATSTPFAVPVVLIAAAMWAGAPGPMSTICSPRALFATNARLPTSTTCRPFAPAATYAYVPLTSTLFANPGMLTNESGIGEKFLTVPAAVPVRPAIVTVIAHEPETPANT